MDRRNGRRIGPRSPRDHSYASQAVLNPIFAPCCTIFEAILIICWSKFVIFFKPIKPNLEQSGTCQHRHANVSVYEPLHSDAHDRYNCKVNDHPHGCPCLCPRPRPNPYPDPCPTRDQRPEPRPGTKGQGHGIKDQGPGTRTRDPGPRTRTRDQGPGIRDQGSGTRVQRPGGMREAIRMKKQ